MLCLRKNFNVCIKLLFSYLQNIDELIVKAVPANILMDRELNLDEPLGTTCTVYDNMTELLIRVPIMNVKIHAVYPPWEILLQTTAKYELPKQVLYCKYCCKFKYSVVWRLFKLCGVLTGQWAEFQIPLKIHAHFKIIFWPWYHKELLHFSSPRQFDVCCCLGWDQVSEKIILDLPNFK